MAREIHMRTSLVYFSLSYLTQENMQGHFTRLGVITINNPSSLYLEYSLLLLVMASESLVTSLWSTHSMVDLPSQALLLYWKLNFFGVIPSLEMKKLNSLESVTQREGSRDEMS
jgi:hypothetical protein